MDEELLRLFTQIQNYIDKKIQELSEKETCIALREQQIRFRTFTTSQAAALLSVNSRTVIKYILSGQLKAARIGKEYTIREDELIRFQMSMEEDLSANIQRFEMVGRF